MGRQSRKKRQRRRQKRGELLHEDRLELAPGIEAVRRGRVIEFVNRQSPEQFAAFIEEQRALAIELPGRLRDRIGVLREQLASLPLRETLSQLSLARYTANPETFIEPDIPPFLGLEYLTWLYLTANPTPPIDGPATDPASLQSVFDLLDEIIRDTQWRLMTDHLIHPHPGGPAMDDLVMRTRLQHLFVRGHAYHHHIEGHVMGLFEPFGAELRTALGFDVAQVITLAAAIHRFVNQRLMAQQAKYHETYERWTTALKDPAAMNALEAEEREVVARLGDVYGDAREGALHMLGAWLFFASQAAFTVQARELAEAVDTAEDVVTRFLDHFSLAPGLDPVGDSNPSVYEAQVRAPLVKVAEDEWLAHLPPHIWWAIKPSLETVLHGEGHWARYDRHRASYLERRAVELISSTSSHARSWTGLRYRFDDGDGPRDYELDGLVIVDETAFLIEAKAGVMTAPARRGAPDRLLSNLESLVADAYRQAARAERFLQSAETVTFRTRAERVSVSNGDLRHTFLISVTLDPLSAFVTHLASLEELGIVPPSSRLWSVYLGDLEVITDLVEGAGQLVHYLTRREQVQSMNVVAHDELDWFGHYLLEGLYFEDVRSGRLRGMSLNTYTTGFDAYYSYLAGERETPVEKPRQPMPEELRRLLSKLEAAGPRGFVEAISQLLEGDSATRKEIGRSVSRQRLRAAETGLAGFRISIDHTALAYLCGRSPSQAVIDAYTSSALEYEGIARVVGVLEDVADPDVLYVSVRERGAPITEEERAAVAELLQGMRSQSLTRGRKRPAG